MTLEQIKQLKQGDKIYALEDENTSTQKMPDFKWRELEYDSADIEENKVHFKVYVRYDPGFVKSLDEEDIKLYSTTKEEAIKDKIEYYKKEIIENEIYEKRDFIGLFFICAKKMNDYYKKCINCLERMLNPPKPMKVEIGKTYYKCEFYSTSVDGKGWNHKYSIDKCIVVDIFENESFNGYAVVAWNYANYENEAQELSMDEFIRLCAETKQGAFDKALAKEKERLKRKQEQVEFMEKQGYREE